MKTYVGLGLLTGVLALSAVVGGCVPKDEYDKLWSQNRNAQEQLSQTQAALTQLKAQRDDLERRLNECEAALARKDGDIQALTNEHKRLLGDLAALEQKLKDLGAVTGPIGPVLGNELDLAFRELEKAFPGILKYHSESGMVEFSSDLTFDKGSDDVSAKAKQALAQFVKIANSQAAQPFTIMVVGHTDDIPIVKDETKRLHPTNWYLSVHRAVAVQEELMKSGLAPTRLGVAGFSEYRWIEPNAAGKKGNAANRRVELWFVRPNLFASPKTVAR